VKAKLFALFMICSLGLFAQSWCPTGANWYYPYYPCFGPGGGIGYTHYYYSGDTVVAGQNCKIITSISYNGYTGSTVVDTVRSHIITRQSGDTVYHVSDTAFIPYLYFAAKAGDTIIVPNQNMLMPAVVDSNGKQWIANDSLRYYYFHFTDTCYRSYYKPYMVIERMGDVSNDFFPQWLSNCGAVEDFCFPFFSCYADSSVQQFSINPSMPCYYLTLNVEQLSSSAQLQIEPNPASGFVTINYNIAQQNDNPTYLEISNLLGQKVYSQILPTTNHYQLDISRFATGAYIVALKRNEGLIGIAKLQVF